MPALTATLRPVSRPTSGHDLLEVCHQPLVGAPDRVDEAELARAQRRRLPGGGQHLVVGQQRDRLHRRVEARRLRAELAVLRAAAGLGREDALDLDQVAAPSQTHVVGQLGQRRDVRIGQRRQRGQLAERQLAPLVEQRSPSVGEQVGRGRHGVGP